jgi:hypothetical protein
MPTALRGQVVRFDFILASGDRPPQRQSPVPVPVKFDGRIESEAKQDAIMAVAGNNRDNVPLPDISAALVQLDPSRQSLVVKLSGNYCGATGNCEIELYEFGTRGWKKVNNWSGYDISVLPTTSQGRYDLGVSYRGGLDVFHWLFDHYAAKDGSLGQTGYEVTY